MAVGATCSGTLRWRALGRASELLCPLHRRQLAVMPGPGLHSRRAYKQCRPTGLPLAGRSTAPRLSLQKPRLQALSSAGAYHAAALLAATTTTFPPAVATTTLPPGLTAFVALLPSIGTFLVCLAAAIFLLSSLPVLWALGRATHRAERVLAVVEAELPDTVASMRLASLEVTDCIQELGALGGELTRGVRSTAALASTAEASVRSGVVVADAALRNHVIPAVAKAERDARGAVEGHLAATAKLSYTGPLVSQAAAATTTAARRLRAGLAVGRLVGAAVQAGRSARDALERHQLEQAQVQRQGLDSNPDLELQQQLELQQRLEEEEQVLRQELEALRLKHSRQTQVQHIHHRRQDKGRQG